MSQYIEIAPKKEGYCHRQAKTMDTIETISPRIGTILDGGQSRSGFGRRLVRLVAGLIKWLDHQLERRRSRLALLEMTDCQLKDIGLSRCDAYREASRPFWN